MAARSTSVSWSMDPWGRSNMGGVEGGDEGGRVGDGVEGD